MIVRPAPLPVLPKSPIVFQAVDGGWIRMTFVKKAHLLPNARGICASCFVVFHGTRVAPKKPCGEMVPCMGGSTRGRGAPAANPARLSLAVTRNLRQYGVQVEGSRLLPRWELCEVRDLRRHHRLHHVDIGH